MSIPNIVAQPLDSVNQTLSQKESENHSQNYAVTPNVSDMRSFCEALAPLGGITFQLFGEGTHELKPLILHGTFDQLGDQLVALNKQGYGVFVTVSETNGQGRSKTDITAPRALFLDFDGVVPDGAKLALLPKPSAVVQSRNGQHLYWFLELGEELARLEPALAQLIPFMGSDRACKDMGRVMRLPGSLHHKQEPWLTSLLSLNEVYYTFDQVMANVPALPAAKAKVRSQPQAKLAPGAKATVKLNVPSEGVTVDNFHARLKKVNRPQQLEWMLAALEECTEGGRNALLNMIAFRVYELTQRGVPAAWLEAKLTESALKCGLELAEISTTINSAFTAAKDSGKGLNASQKLRRAFDLHYGASMRYNARQKLLELDGAAVVPDVELIDFVDNNPVGGLDPEPRKFAGAIAAWARHSHSYDPAQEWLESLPVMSVEAAHAELNQLADVMGIADTHERTLLKRWLVGVPNRILVPGCVQTYALMLSGKGGCGKSTFFNELAPLKLARNMPALGASGVDKDAIIAAHKSTVLVIDEADEVTLKADISALKLFIGTASDTFRVPYGLTDETLSRSFSIGATANGEQPLRDDGASLRRWVCIKLSGGELEGKQRYLHYASRYEAINAAALALYKAGYTSELTDAEKLIEQGRKEGYTDHSLAYSQALDQLPALADSITMNASRGKGYAFHFEQLARKFTGRDRWSRGEAKDIEKALELSGWHLKKQCKVKGKNQRLCWPKRVETGDIVALSAQNI
jgi:predicted P-loop ATPase